ncbi:MAG TPA: phospholipase D-like domain-containing protein [Methylomirabilota bacterium]|nr:phospholipase D-like domain-containing protein [Methylomirabilota bacterium]
MDWAQSLAKVWQYLVLGLTVGLSLLGSGHALLHKRDPRAATLWVAVIWSLPLVGAALYFILGVNRIKRQAVLLRGGLEHFRARQTVRECAPEQLATTLPPAARHLTSLASTVGRVVSRPLLPGNRADLLVDGDAAYPAMLEAIASARRSIALATYIFDRDEAGLAFARALGDAVRRGVEVRVLIDATGTRYSWPPVLGELRRQGVPYARFRPAFPLWRLLSMNLRNHRKILVVDGRTGFTGGMNLRVGHWLAKQPRHPVRDLHFRLEGPVVAHLQEAFADDWLFTTGETLRGDAWFPPLEECGSIIARGIADGPDEDFEQLRWTILAALSAARSSVRIATPYFLPDPTLIASLNLAAMRGVSVHILLPARGNLPFVQWASTAHWWQVLERGCRLWLSPPPFDHSKMLVVDEAWSLVGSANWDPRSLRLNFEFNVECYDTGLARTLNAWFDERLRQSRETSLAEVDARGLAVRLRDGAARLLTPFL